MAPLQSSSLSSTTLLDTVINNTDGNSTADTESMNSLSLSVLNLTSLENGRGSNAGNDQSHTNPLDVPPSSIIDTSSDCGHTFAYSAGDSGYSGTDPWNVSCSSYCPYSSTRSSFGSVYSDRDSCRKLSIDSSMNTESGGVIGRNNDGNLQRRVLRNISTSFENRHSTSDFIGYIGDNLQQSNGVGGNGTGSGTSGGSDGCVIRGGRRCSEQVESRSNPEMFRKRGTGTHFSSFGPHHRITTGTTIGGTSVTTRRPKLGLAVCITFNETVANEMQLFCSEHICLFELMLCRLRSIAENACINRKKFLKVNLT